MNIGDLAVDELAEFLDGLAGQIEDDDPQIYVEPVVHAATVRLRDALAVKANVDLLSAYETLRTEAREAPRYGLTWCCGILQQRQASGGLTDQDALVLLAYGDELRARRQELPS